MSDNCKVWSKLNVSLLLAHFEFLKKIMEILMNPNVVQNLAKLSQRQKYLQENTSFLVVAVSGCGGLLVSATVLYS